MKTKLAAVAVTVFLVATIAIGLVHGASPIPTQSAAPTASPTPTPTPTPIPQVDPPPITPGYQAVIDVQGNFSGDSNYFTIDSTNWEIRWAYTPLSGSASLQVTVYPTAQSAISRSGDLETGGTVYLTNNNQPWYYLTVTCSDVQDYTLLIDQQTPQATPTPSPTPTPTPTPTPIVTDTPSPTPSPTPTPTATANQTQTPQPTLSPSPTPTITPTPMPTNQTLVIPDYTNPPSKAGGQINMIGVSILVAFIIACVAVTVYLRVKHRGDHPKT